MTSFNKLALLYTLGAGMGNGLIPVEYNPFRQNITEEDVKAHFAPKGTLFTFSDGFECYALNQRNANRKHEKFLMNK